MSPRKTILRELNHRHEADGGDRFARPATLSGFGDNPDKYQATVNKLLQDRLIEGRKDEEGRMAIALNAHRLADVHRELRPAWRHPAVWLLMAVIALAAAGIMA